MTSPQNKRHLAAYGSISASAVANYQNRGGWELTRLASQPGSILHPETDGTVASTRRVGLI